MKKKKVVILGSTGSIGVNTLKVVERLSNDFEVVGLTAYNNVRLIEKQVKKFKPKYIAVPQKGAKYLAQRIDTRQTKILSVDNDLEYLVSLKHVDIVVIGMRGSAALSPFLAAVRAGKLVAPANKEALVIAGEIIMREAKKHGATIVPVDSEQSAIYQCLSGQNKKELHKVLLTASGGALLNTPSSKFDRLTIKQILDHPRWKMGKKITVDSATLMNKGFEVIEAKNLFDLDMKQIEVIVHPEAIIHSMAEFVDGSIIAQLSVTDMRLPIQFALTYPNRYKTNLKYLNFMEFNQLNFQKPDLKKFPALKLAFHVGQKSGTLPSVLNAADEEAVEAFLNGRIKFTAIYKAVEKVVLKHKVIKNPNLDDILRADEWARAETGKVLKSIL